MERAAISVLQCAGGDALRVARKWLIRPARDKYALSDLGAEHFNVGHRRCHREDLSLTSSQGHVLECSHFIPAAAPGDKWPCVVYLHGNSSSRCEALAVVPWLLQRGVAVFAFDFAGCGHSSGPYVSLGHFEERDLGVVLRHLRRSGAASSIALWGRSMGASTAVLRAAKDHSLAACVLDSPFADLRQVCEEFIGKVAIPLPKFLADAVLDATREEVLARAGFDMYEVAPALAAPKARCPALFAASGADHLVLPHHAKDLRALWGGESELCALGGGHNDARPDSFLSQAAAFLSHKLEAVGGPAPPPLAGAAPPSALASVLLAALVPCEDSPRVDSLGALVDVQPAFCSPRTFSKAHSASEAAPRRAWRLRKSAVRRSGRRKSTSSKAGDSAPIV